MLTLREMIMKKTLYRVAGKDVFLRDEADLCLQPDLPVGTYAVRESLMGYYLERLDGFELPPKLYGNTASRASRILNTFLDRPNGTGVLLSGEKGAGKSLLAKTVATFGLQQGISCIIISEPLFGEEFNLFIQSINCPVVILFDEFEKVYDSEQQAAMLSLLDGMYPSKKLYLLTVNDSGKVNSFMLNRPGRIFYHIDFAGLSLDFVEEYCKDHLKNKEHSSSVLNLAGMFEAFTFDMLQAVIEEMNRYNEPAPAVMAMLNVKPEPKSTKYSVVAQHKGIDVTEMLDDTFWWGNPSTETLRVEVTMPNTNSNEAADSTGSDTDQYEYITWRLTPNHVVKANGAKGEYTYYDAKQELTVILTEVKAPKFNLTSWL